MLPICSINRNMSCSKLTTSFTSFGRGCSQKKMVRIIEKFVPDTTKCAFSHKITRSFHNRGKNGLV